MSRKTVANRLQELEAKNKELSVSLTSAGKVIREMYADIKRLAFLSTLLVVASISYVLYTL